MLGVSIPSRNWPWSYMLNRNVFHQMRTGRRTRRVRTPYRCGASDRDLIQGGAPRAGPRVGARTSRRRPPPAGSRRRNRRRYFARSAVSGEAAMIRRNARLGYSRPRVRRDKPRHRAGRSEQDDQPIPRPPIARHVDISSLKRHGRRAFAFGVRRPRLVWWGRRPRGQP